MQLTIDSTESIDKVLPAVGAMFGVHVQVAPPSTDAAAAAPEASQPSGSRRGGRKRTAQRPSSRGRRSKGDDSALVREWAKANGFQVADRGRISEAVRNAYRAA